MGNFGSIGRKLILVLGVFGVSWSAILVRYSTAPSMVLVIYRMLFATLLLSIPAAKQFQEEKSIVTKEDYIRCIISGIFLAFHFTTYFESVKWTSVASTSLLSNFEIFFVAMAQIAIFHEIISVKGWIGILVTIAGSIVLTAGDAGTGPDMLKGDLLSLTAAACLAVNSMIGKSCRKHMGTNLYTCILYCTAGLTCLLICAVTRVPVLGYGAVNFATGFGMTILCTLMGHNIFNWGLKYFRASYISTVKLSEPLFSATTALVLFHEYPPVTAILGGIIIVAGIIYYSANTVEES